MKHNNILLIICICLGIIPFFWLKPGWVDLGGDSSRLYFYDPINYLKSFPLYVIAPTGTSIVMIGHYLIPFVFFIAILKTLFSSVYLVITIFNSFQLIVSFFSVYLIVKEFLKYNSKTKKEFYAINYASVAGGIFYTLSPFLSPNGWDKAMFVHNQFFLNPLIFLLLFKFIQTKKMQYLLFTLLISFIFAPNFSPGPQIFSFYSLAILYLFLYAKLVLKLGIDFKKIVLIFVLFLFLHAFHLIPQILLFVTVDNSAYRQATFSEEGILVRGLGYFTAIARTTHFIYNFLSLPQLPDELVTVAKPLQYVWFIFPILLIYGLFLYKKIEPFRNKTRQVSIILLLIFFLLVLFLATANVTYAGFSFYTQLFHIPGFSMFRNYVGQFSFVYIFFYALLLSQSLFFVFTYIKRTKSIILSLVLLLIITLSSLPFIRGDMINLIENKGFKTEVSVPIKMDPEYEAVLDYIRKSPLDVKYLSLPLTEGGLQILAGSGGGAYQGPSTISYLTGKVDFAGRSGLIPFGELFLTLAREKNYEGINNLLSILNIKYIFYNSDSYIFTDNFSRIPPYQEMHKYLPVSQNSYKIFIEQLDVRKKIDFGKKYHIYEVNNTSYLPHIYIAKEKSTLNVPFTSTTLPILKGKDKRIAFVEPSAPQDIDNTIDSYYMKALSSSFTFDYFLNKKTVKLSTFISPKDYGLFFPFFRLPQSIDIPDNKRIYDKYFDNSIYEAEKIISTIEKNKDLKTLSPAIASYGKLISDIINKVKSKDEVINRAISLKDIVTGHENRIVSHINVIDTLSNEEKLSLLKISDQLFENFHISLGGDSIQPVKINYLADIKTPGEYEILVKNSKIRSKYKDKVNIVINGIPVPQDQNQPNKDWIHFTLSSFKKNSPITLTIPWEVSRDEKELWNVLENKEASNSSNFILDGVLARDYVSANINIFSEWKPNTTYVVSFDYRRTNLTEDENGNTVVTPSSNWRRYAAVINSSGDGKGLVMQILTNDEEHIDPVQPPPIQVKNLSVEQMPSPEILLIKRIAQEEKNIPRITISKINATKYRVEVKDAVNPYTLVFSDTFNKNWKLFILDKKMEGKTLKDKILRIIGRSLSNVMYQRDKTLGSIVARYFNGEVEERASENTFLDSSTFEAWGYRSVTQNSHFMVNGYANAWEIKPSDVGGLKDYTIILEMTDQRVFYLSFFLSVVTFSICLLWLIMLLSFRYWRK